jgi:hypothetical protein
VRTWTADSAGPAATAWALMSRPTEWPQWAPHMRGFWSSRPLGDGEITQGAWGAARVLGVVPVPVIVTGKEARRSWTWQFGLTRITHRVEPRAGSGCRVAVDLEAPWPLESLLAATWGPVFGLSLRRLARLATESRSAASA